jgi:hypothetical protein
VLAGNLSAFEIKRVAIAVAGGLAKNADVAVVVEPPKLPIVRNITPQEVTPDAVPCATFRPECASVQSLNWRVADLSEPRVEDDNVRIRITNRIVSGPIAFGGKCDGA